jgi:hypothetical protein
MTRPLAYGLAIAVIAFIAAVVVLGAIDGKGW